MKILVFADVHGNVDGMEAALRVFSAEKPNKVVFCGDIFGGWSDTERQIAELAQRFDVVTYFVRGNNDRAGYDNLLPGGFEEYAVMHHFGRTLFFTHGDRYNAFRVPPILQQGDAVVYGHTHVGSLTVKNGLFALNVGSIARPRDGRPCYLVLDDGGATLKHRNGTVLYTLPWTSIEK